jgi:hypothetical protein
MSEPSVGTRGTYLQLSVIFFAIDMASAIIMVFFACLAIDFLLEELRDTRGLWRHRIVKWFSHKANILQQTCGIDEL